MHLRQVDESLESYLQYLSVGLIVVGVRVYGLSTCDGVVWFVEFVEELLGVLFGGLVAELVDEFPPVLSGMHIPFLPKAYPL